MEIRVDDNGSGHTAYTHVTAEKYTGQAARRGDQGEPSGRAKERLGVGSENRAIPTRASGTTEADPEPECAGEGSAGSQDRVRLG